MWGRKATHGTAFGPILTKAITKSKDHECSTHLITPISKHLNENKTKLLNPNKSFHHFTARLTNKGFPIIYKIQASFHQKVSKFSSSILKQKAKQK